MCSEDAHISVSAIYSLYIRGGQTWGIYLFCFLKCQGSARVHHLDQLTKWLWGQVSHKTLTKSTQLSTVLLKPILDLLPIRDTNIRFYIWAWPANHIQVKEFWAIKTSCDFFWVRNGWRSTTSQPEIYCLSLSYFLSISVLQVLCIYYMHSLKADF